MEGPVGPLIGGWRKQCRGGPPHGSRADAPSLPLGGACWLVAVRARHKDDPNDVRLISRGLINFKIPILVT
eukprot:SAG31_NODE_401_length_16206_cov_10.920780_2_plen_71_part_00